MTDSFKTTQYGAMYADLVKLNLKLHPARDRQRDHARVREEYLSRAGAVSGEFLRHWADSPVSHIALALAVKLSLHYEALYGTREADGMPDQLQDTGYWKMWRDLTDLHDCLYPVENTQEYRRRVMELHDVFVGDHAGDDLPDVLALELARSVVYECLDGADQVQAAV